MTDKIDFGKSIGPIGGLNKARKVETTKAEAGKATTDRVDFSSVLQEVNKTRETSMTSNVERNQKVAALKAQVESGSYRPDLEKVASSLVAFLAAEK
ncbi:MAG: flagellar biosynthesis anti-sigma factor FlgM [Desulfuromonadaceae bacterium]|jgi:negative regulator of flagellin synthesis FlgM